jgi:hypothetical protein
MKVIFDFDGILSNKASQLDDALIVNSKLGGDGFFNINDLPDQRKKSLDDFKMLVKQLEKQLPYNFPFKGHRPELFNAVFFPLSQWLDSIDFLIKRGQLTTQSNVIFTTYSNNSKIFFLEAEGESQGSLFYKSSYYLSRLVYLYLKSQINVSIQIEKDVSLISKIAYWSRGSVFILFKAMQQFSYNIYQRLRKTDLKSVNKYIFLSRGIIQSQFIESIKHILEPNYYSIVVNESAVFPFRNKYYYDKKEFSLHYIEGNIPFNVYFRHLFYLLRGYFWTNLRKNDTVYFRGVPIPSNHIFPELFISKFYCETQALALKYFLNRTPNISKLISFDMLSAQPFYIKLLLENSFIQIQTTLMADVVQDDFIHGEKFYFTDQISYNKHKIVNNHLASKFGLLNNIKYVSIVRKDQVKEINRVTFFTQPVHLNEELEILSLLKKWTNLKGFQLSLKLHPRSQEKDYKKLDLPFMDSEQSSLDAVEKSHLVITRNSSIGKDAWTINTPVLFMVYGQLNSKNIPYIPEDYKGSFQSKPTIKLLNEFVNNLEYYYNHSFHKSTNFDLKMLKAELKKK